MDRDFFLKALAQQQLILDALTEKATHNYQTYVKNIKKMEQSNLKIIGKMNIDAATESSGPATEKDATVYYYPPEQPRERSASPPRVNTES